MDKDSTFTPGFSMKAATGRQRCSATIASTKTSRLDFQLRTALATVCFLASNFSLEQPSDLEVMPMSAVRLYHMVTKVSSKDGKGGLKKHSSSHDSPPLKKTFPNCPREPLLVQVAISESALKFLSAADDTTCIEYGIVVLFTVLQKIRLRKICIGVLAI